MLQESAVARGIESLQKRLGRKIEDEDVVSPSIGRRRFRERASRLRRAWWSASTQRLPH
jgi:hypothetical protein